MAGKEQAANAEATATRYIAQRETGPWSEEDAAELQRWLDEASLHRVIYYRMNTAWREAGRLKALHAPASFQRTAGNDAIPAGGLFMKWSMPTKGKLFALAASVLIAVGGALATYWYFNLRDTYATPIGVMQSVPLPDGTRITLNTDSKLRVALSDRERRIELNHGEVYFEVAHDPGRPFVVHAGSKRITAVGTRFSVRRENDDVRVAVTEGTVRIEDDNAAGGATPRSGELTIGSVSGEQPVLLHAGTIATAASGGMTVKQHALTDVEQELSWREGLLTFHNTPLADAVAEFNRYNTRKIVIQDRAIATIQVGGIFGSTQPAQFVRLLEQGLPIQATTEGERIVLTSRP